MPVMMWGGKKRTKITAVDESNFEAFLKQLGVYESVVAGGVRCVVCGNVLSTDDIDAIFPEDGEVKFLCRSPKCALQIANANDNA
jgi:hypothetical protein